MIERSIMQRLLRPGLAGMAAVLCVLISGCTPDYSPNTYSSNAAQQANKVDQGVIVGVRAVQISADTTLATASGAAAGGVVGSTVGNGSTAALGAVGGTVAGGVVGSVIGHAAGDTDGYEYIVKKANGELMSVTQKDLQPLGVGAHVLIIEGPQARVVPDYTVPVVVEGLHPEEAKPAAKPEPASTQPGTIPAATPPAPTPTQVPALPVSATPAPQPATAATAAVVSTPLPPPPPAAAPAAMSSPPAADQKPTAQPTPETPKPEDSAPPKPASGG
jgi:outer membrane lipoprotein SlyB